MQEARSPGSRGADVPDSRLLQEGALGTWISRVLYPGRGGLCFIQGLSGRGAETREAGICDSGPLRFQDGWHGGRAAAAAAAAPHLRLESLVPAVGRGAVAWGFPFPQPPGLISCSRPRGGGATFRPPSQRRVKTPAPWAMNIHEKAGRRQATPSHSKRLADFSLLQQGPSRRENPELVTHFLLLANQKLFICICNQRRN